MFLISKIIWKLCFNEHFRNEINNKRFPREYAGFTMAEYKELNGFRETVPEYVKDYVPLMFTWGNKKIIMLDQTTKWKLDSARQILVGKVPDPKQQLIRLWMHWFTSSWMTWITRTRRLDSIQFFVEEWKNILTKLLTINCTGAVDLYVQVISNMSNLHIPQLFPILSKDILPYRDPRTLSLFWKRSMNLLMNTVKIWGMLLNTCFPRKPRRGTIPHTSPHYWFYSWCRWSKEKRNNSWSSLWDSGLFDFCL